MDQEQEDEIELLNQELIDLNRQVIQHQIMQDIEAGYETQDSLNSDNE